MNPSVGSSTYAIPPYKTYHRNIPKHGEKVVRLGLWKLSSLSTKSVRCMFSGISFVFFNVRRVRQRNNDRRFDLYVDLPSYVSNKEAMIRTIDKAGGHVKLFTKVREKSGETPYHLIGDVSDRLKAMTLNINGAFSKREDLCLLLDIEKPVIVGLQETLVHKGKNFFLPGYATINAGKSSSEGSRGLALAIKNGSGLMLSEYKADDNFLAGVVEGLDQDKKLFTLLVLNVYIPNKGELRKAALGRLACFLRKENIKSRFDEIVLLGDWNGNPEQVNRTLLRKKLSLNVDFLDFSSPTRRNNSGRMGRCIDFFACMGRSIILDQQVLRRWDISDHYPVVATLNLAFLKPVKKVFIFDRKKIQDAKVVEAIATSEKWDRISGSSISIEEFANSFLEQMKELSFEHQILRQKREKRITLYSQKTRKAILKRRDYFALYDSEGFNASTYAELSKTANSM
ncbi:hypothetical protein DMUE_5351, partial [Dictyocoela muelleri]